MFNKLNPPNIDNIEFLTELQNEVYKDELFTDYNKSLITQMTNEIVIINEEFEANYNNYFVEILADDIRNNTIIDNLIKEDVGRLWKHIFKPKLKKMRIYDKLKEETLVDDEYTCPVCGLIMSEDSNSKDFFSLDHVVPKSKNAQYIIYLFNLVPMCRRCNANKNDSLFKGIYHPYYSQETIYPKNKIKVQISQENRRGISNFRVAYNWIEQNNEDQKNNFEIFKLKKIYNERIYKEKIWNYYKPLIDSFMRTSNKNEQIKKNVEKTIENDILKLESKIKLNDEEVLVLMTLKAISYEFESFFNSIIDQRIPAMSQVNRDSNESCEN